MLISILKCSLVRPSEKVTHILVPFCLYCLNFSLTAMEILLACLEECQKKQVRVYSQLYVPTSCSLCSRLAVDLLPLVSTLIYTGTLVIVPVSLFTWAARKPRART